MYDYSFFFFFFFFFFSLRYFLRSLYCLILCTYVLSIHPLLTHLTYTWIMYCLMYCLYFLFYEYLHPNPPHLVILLTRHVLFLCPLPHPHALSTVTCSTNMLYHKTKTSLCILSCQRLYMCQCIHNYHVHIVHMFVITSYVCTDLSVVYSTVNYVSIQRNGQCFNEVPRFTC